jgi:2-C-methyl-D-erythritol 4-phosphate cytidylyltransferase/2-C-methyl-D-erythritol 2,4-cyclodiphosphate synthase
VEDAVTSGTIAIIVAAGHGVRAGEGLPKQYRLVAGRPVLRQAIEVFLHHPRISEVQVVVGADHVDLYLACVDGLQLRPPVIGGATRQASVLNALRALASRQPEKVLIHDAARPFVTHEMISQVLDALEGHAAVVPVLPVADTLKQVGNGHVTKTLSREGVVQAQTPQGFHYQAIRGAHEAAQDADHTDDASIAEAAGMSVATVQGARMNFKLTTAEDFAMAERIALPLFTARVGSGYDVHRFCAGDHVWLCGVRVPHDQGLEGHSDADVALHALTDAILGAAAQGDIGQHFPPSDARWKGAPSHLFLAHAADIVRKMGGQIGNVDVTIICERPKVSPHREAMQQRVCAILGLDQARVSVKATTTEGLGFTGRREGIAAQATATVFLP